MEPITSAAADRREQQAQLQALVQETLFRRWRAVLAWILMFAGGIAILSAAAEGAESEVRRAVWRRGRG